MVRSRRYPKEELIHTSSRLLHTNCMRHLPEVILPQMYIRVEPVTVKAVSTATVKTFHGFNLLSTLLYVDSLCAAPSALTYRSTEENHLSAECTCTVEEPAVPILESDHLIYIVTKAKVRRQDIYVAWCLFSLKKQTHQPYLVSVVSVDRKVGYYPIHLPQK